MGGALESSAHSLYSALNICGRHLAWGWPWESVVICSLKNKT